MRKLILLLLLLPITALAQYREVEEYSIDGITITKGQEIEIGQPSGINDVYVYVLTKGNFGSPPIPIKQNIGGLKAKIEEIRVLKQSAGGLDDANIVFKIRKAKFMIRIRPALLQKELII